MSAPRFIHLRLHSEYSITDGAVRLDTGKNHECPPVRRAAEYGMPALALTDLSNMFGALKFYNAARHSGVKPLLGSDVYISNTTDPERPGRLLLLCRSNKGYHQLCELLSRASLTPRSRGRAEISREMLREVGTDGLIALSGTEASDVGEALVQENIEHARSRASEWAALFPGAFYLEIQRASSLHTLGDARQEGHERQERLVAATAELAAELDLPLVATHPIQFMDREDFTAHEVRVCIADGLML
ncbi:MAG: PHP domain-containing protein, partial [Candidatus Accumulibacter sp.]|nr:PHP domain-containing protein [Accumulibacter sp.]